MANFSGVRVFSGRVAGIIHEKRARALWSLRIFYFLFTVNTRAQGHFLFALEYNNPRGAGCINKRAARTRAGDDEWLIMGININKSWAEARF